MIYTHLLRPILFALSQRNPEAIHERTLRALALLGATPPLLALTRLACSFQHFALPRVLWNCYFPNPLGLAAGFDKNGLALTAWQALGFGFVEAGTVTHLPQPGNPRPRLFRLPADGALINRMGFNNHGAKALSHKLADTGKLAIPLGISLGKSKATALEDAPADYSASLALLYHYGDYFAINVSSPNTPGLRALQDRAQLAELLAALNAEVRRLAGNAPPKPLLVKLAPDLSDQAIGELLAVCADHAISGLIATNTTIARPHLRQPINETGGLSGQPLAPRALEVVRFIARETQGRLPIIGVGGIFTPADAQRMLDAGATLLQSYTGFVYQGPAFAKQINKHLATGLP